VLASRLSEDEGVSVLLLEAGPDDRGVAKISTPALAVSLWHSDLDWEYYTVPQKHSHLGYNGRVNTHNPRTTTTTRMMMRGRRRSCKRILAAVAAAAGAAAVAATSTTITTITIYFSTFPTTRVVLSSSQPTDNYNDAAVISAVNDCHIIALVHVMFYRHPSPSLAPTPQL
jgi:hypothetical protein